MTARFVAPQSPPGILTLIAADLANFILFFGYFMVERAGEPMLYARSARALDVRLGLLNTIILITSGWLVAMALEAARSGRQAAARRRLAFALGTGSIFVVVKTFEYSSKLKQGLAPQTNDFFQFYYVLTGVHLLHVVIGLALLAAAFVRLRRIDAAGAGWLESSALFWHMVDVLWVFLFAMLYLQGAS